MTPVKFSSVEEKLLFLDITT